MISLLATVSGSSVAGMLSNIGSVVTTAAGWGTEIIAWITGSAVLMVIVCLKLSRYAPKVVKSLVGVVKSLGR